MSNQSKKEYFRTNEAGWGKLLGNVDLVSPPSPATATPAGTSQPPKPVSLSGKYFARFYAPISAIGRVHKTGIRAEKKYQVGFNVTSDSQTGFFAATVTFRNDAGVSLGFPYSTSVNLSTLKPNEYSPVSFVTGPAPDGATQALLVFTAVGTSPDKVVDINGVYFNETSELS